MTTLLRVDASVRLDGSVSRALADSAEAAWKAEHPDGIVVRRDLGRHPIPAGVWPALVSERFGGPPADAEVADLSEAKALAADLLDEFFGADAVLLAVPLYNYGIAQHVKTYIDVLMTDPGLLTGNSPVTGRPVILTLARGGGYGPGTPKEGWDHATPYLERIFGEVFGMRLRKAEAELTLAPVTPGMEGLIEASKVSAKEAHSVAEIHAAEVARELAEVAA